MFRIGKATVTESRLVIGLWGEVGRNEDDKATGVFLR